MIVRINHFAAAQAEASGGWPALGLQGPIRHDWPADTHAFELLIREHDERNQPLPSDFRRAQLRQLIPEVLAALMDEGQIAILRLDGAVSEMELAPACQHVARSRGVQRFAISAVRKLDPHLPPPVASVRVQTTLAHTAELCAETALGLERSVRLRAICVPAELVVPVLEVDEPDDPSWRHLMPQAAFVLSTVRGLPSLHVLTRRHGPAELQSRLASRLIADGRAGGA